MEDDPVYDYPDSLPLGEKRACPQRGSLKSISVLDRLLLTYPVWLQLSINSATALHILQREPPGTFLVRKSNTSQKKMLCVRLADDSMPSFVKQFIISEKDSNVLPFTLELPEAIAKASSHKQLESISHMGVEFWSSHLNFRGPRNGPSSATNAPPPPKPKSQNSTSCSSSTSTSLFQEFCPIRTRSPSELDLGAGQGALCFINPLFLQEHPVRGAMLKRHHFKRSIKVRVSTENSSPLSPPVSSPPPPPLIEKSKCKERALKTKDIKPSPEPQGTAEANKEDLNYLQPCLTLPKKTSAMVMSSLAPAVENDYQLPKVSQQSEKKILVDYDEETEDGEAGLILEHRHAPSLSDLDSSSSLSSLDEAEEISERPPLTRGTSNPTFNSPPPVPNSVSALRKMSAIFMSFFVPGKRVVRLVEDLSRNRCTAFGTLIQDFLRQQREDMKPECLTSSVKLLQVFRHFINQAKVFLLECGELEPPIEALVPEDEKDLTLEKSLFRCILKPLKGQIDTALKDLHQQDGSCKRLAEGLERARNGSPHELLALQVALPNSNIIEKIKQKMELMRHVYSPIDKVVLLLQFCKLIYKAMKTGTGQQFGADEFLPVLSYVIVQCNMPEMLLEVEYMMELLDNSWLNGEGGYYLTSVYASLSYIQNKPEMVSSSELTPQVKESLKKWSYRRGSESRSQTEIKLNQRFVKVLFQNGDSSLVKTLQWKEDFNADALAKLCAAKFGVEDSEEFGLYWRNAGWLKPIPPDAQIEESTSSAPVIYQHRMQYISSCKLNQEGASDCHGDAS